jgi:hypothetical protein
MKPGYTTSAENTGLASHFHRSRVKNVAAAAALLGCPPSTCVTFAKGALSFQIVRPGKREADARPFDQGERANHN